MARLETPRKSQFGSHGCGIFPKQLIELLIEISIRKLPKRSMRQTQVGGKLLPLFIVISLRRWLLKLRKNSNKTLMSCLLIKTSANVITQTINLLVKIVTVKKLALEMMMEIMNSNRSVLIEWLQIGRLF